MSYRSKRSRSALASKVKDATMQSVNDIVAEVIHNVAIEEGQAPETQQSSSGNVSIAFDKPTMTQSNQVQGTTTEVVDDISNQRNADRRGRGRLTPTPSEPLTGDASRQLRASRRRSRMVDDTDDQPSSAAAAGGSHAPETGGSSFGNQWKDVPARTEPIQASFMEANDFGSNQRNTGRRQELTPPPSQPFIADSPHQLRASQRPSLLAQEYDEEPEQPGFSQGQPSKHLNWNDEIEFDELEQVEMTDSEGRRGKKGGKILPRHVWGLKPGVRFVVPFNALDQPVRKGGYILVKFLGDVAKNGELCPIGEENWHKVDKRYKANIIVLIREKFVLPNREEINKSVLKHVGKKWRGYRHELKMQYKKPGKTQEQVASIVPKGVVPSQWNKLVQYWFSDRYEFLSAKGKEARAAVTHVHTTGPKSYARKRDEFEQQHGREPGAVEWFVQTHKRKDGTYVENTSKEFLDAAAAMIAQRASTSSPSKRVAIENQVFNELMYPDDERHQRPIGYGFGVGRNKVFGVAAELRKNGYLASGTSPEAVSGSQNKMLGVRGEPKRKDYMASDTSAEVERFNVAVAAISETSELMRTQLQMQSQQLQMQSRQLQTQSQQMDGLHLQLQQVTSLLTKFGVILNNPPMNNPTPRAVPRQDFGFNNAQVPRASCAFSDDESDSSEWDSD